MRIVFQILPGKNIISTRCRPSELWPREKVTRWRNSGLREALSMNLNRKQTKKLRGPVRLNQVPTARFAAIKKKELIIEAVFVYGGWGGTGVGVVVVSLLVWKCLMKSRGVYCQSCCEQGHTLYLLIPCQCIRKRREDTRQCQRKKDGWMKSNSPTFICLWVY